MIKQIMVAIAFVLLFIALLCGVSYASQLAPECNVTMPCIAPEQASRSSRYDGRHLGGRPAACAVKIKGRKIAWCGCWLALHKGINDRSLWVARNWASAGKPLPGPRPGAVVVWRNHVGLVMAVDDDRIRVLSGNDGGAVRDRWWSKKGVIAWRMV